MKPYRLAVNMEWTSKCNARCIMCPQGLIQKPQLMRKETFDKVLQRLDTNRVFRTVIAGYGEPTTHPEFMYFVSEIKQHPTRFDMVSNGQQLDEIRLKHLDGSIALLVISFSSIHADVYNRVHVKLDHEKVKQNIILAQEIFKKTQLGISLTPLMECLDSLPETIQWLKQQGVKLLTMSPTLYNRASGTEHQIATVKLRQMIKEHGLHSQELDFVPAIKDIAMQYMKNRFKCVPRNSDLFICASGDYLYCYNNITHEYSIGHVMEHNIDEALRIREKLPAIPALCDICNMRERYKVNELAQVAGNYIWTQLKAS